MTSEKQKRINRNNRKRGGAFEKRVADYLNFEVVPYSGSNARFGYGDVRNDKWLIECKNIKLDGDKLTVKREWIDKNRKRADMYNKYSAIVFMPAGRADKFVIIEYDDYAGAFGGLYDNEISDTVRLEAKVHNTKNLIIHLNDTYIKDVRGGIIVELKFKEEFFYIMTLEKFKRMVYSI